MRRFAAVAVVAAVVTAPGSAQPRWKVIAWRNTGTTTTCGTEGVLLARTKSDAATFACVDRSLLSVVRRIDFSRYVVVGAFVALPSRDDAVRITGLWQPGRTLAVDAHVEEAARGPFRAVAYQVVRVPRTQLQRQPTRRAALQTDLHPPLRVASIALETPTIATVRYSQHPVLAEQVEVTLYRAVGGGWSAVRRLTTREGDRLAFSVEPGATYRAAVTIAPAGQLLAWTAPVTAPR